MPLLGGPLPIGVGKVARGAADCLASSREIAAFAYHSLIEQLCIFFVKINWGIMVADNE